jgi:hypothetical protein
MIPGALCIRTISDEDLVTAATEVVAWAFDAALTFEAPTARHTSAVTLTVGGLSHRRCRAS